MVEEFLMMSHPSLQTDQYCSVFEPELWLWEPENHQFQRGLALWRSFQMDQMNSGLIHHYLCLRVEMFLYCCCPDLA